MKLKHIGLFFLFFLCFKAFNQHKKIFLVAGQSNARGNGDSLNSVIPKIKFCFEDKGKKGVLEPLIDSVGENDAYFQKAGSGTTWPTFAQTLYELSGDSMVIISTARGGTSVITENEGQLDWPSSGLLYSAMKKKVENYLIETGGKLSVITWIQGERDGKSLSNNEINVQKYEASLKNLFHRFKLDFGNETSIYFVPTGFNLDFPKKPFRKIRNAQKRVAHKIKFVTLIFNDTNEFSKKGMMSDNVHYSQEGYNLLGKEIAFKINKIIT